MIGIVELSNKMLSSLNISLVGTEPGCDLCSCIAQQCTADRTRAVAGLKDDRKTDNSFTTINMIFCRSS